MKLSDYISYKGVLCMNLVPGIDATISEISRLENMRHEHLMDLKSAFNCLSKYTTVIDYYKDFEVDSDSSYLINENKIYICKVGAGCNVIPALQIIIDKMKEIEEKIDMQINDLNGALVELRALNTTCEKCKGSGKVYKPRPNVYCERETMTCPECHGLGIIKK